MRVAVIGAGMAGLAAGHRLVAEGHEVGNHLTRDEPSIRLTPAEFEAAWVRDHRHSGQDTLKSV